MTAAVVVLAAAASVLALFAASLLRIARADRGSGFLAAFNARGGFDHLTGYESDVVIAAADLADGKIDDVEFAEAVADAASGSPERFASPR